MNKYLEYAKLYAKGLTELDKVIASRWNAALDQFNLLSPGKKEEAQRRLAICEQCPFNSVNAPWSQEYVDLHGEYYNSNRSDLHCSSCGCPLEYKTLAMDSQCGHEEYNIQNPDKPQLELKWNVYTGA